jgi:tetratricopeptide (TPR) repeat protein
MPLEHPDQKFFEAACGYAELGLFIEANEELENVDASNRAVPEILALRVEIYRRLEKFELMAEVARRLAEFQPNEVQWRTDFAYAIRRCQSVEAAKEILIAAESKFPKEAIIKYNLACYECVLGNIELAKEHLKKAFEIDASWRLQALDDEDLKALWDSL